MEEQSISVRISLEAYQVLVLRKLKTRVPITQQIDEWLKIKVKNGKRSIKCCGGK